MSFGMVAAAGVAAAGAIGGAAISSSASKSAANTQANAANHAADIQQQQFDQTQQNLAPYLRMGNNAIPSAIQAMGYNGAYDANGNFGITGIDANNPLQQRLGQFSAPTAAQAQATPGYQFTQEQGLKAVQNSAAARGLGTSGAALKGAAGYATGLADSTYNDVYNRALNAYNANAGAFQTNYNAQAGNANRLMNVVGSGQNAAATQGGLGATAAGNIGNTLMGGANASAAGQVGSANALSSGLTGAGNNALLYGLMQNNAGGGGNPLMGAVQFSMPGSVPGQYNTGFAGQIPAGLSANGY